MCSVFVENPRQFILYTLHLLGFGKGEEVFQNSSDILFIGAEANGTQHCPS